MKRILLLSGIVLSATLLRSQPVPIDEISGPDNSIADATFGVSTRYPAGWIIRGATRWGDHDNPATTLFFGAAESPEATPSLYYRKFHVPLPNPPGGAETWLRDEARRKVLQRVKQEDLDDYANRPGSFVFREIGGHGALSWTADFTRAGVKWSEYLTAVLSQNGLALFFLQAPSDRIGLVIPKDEEMIQAFRMP